jgi:homocysteine S-methyltransferase
MHRPRIVDGGLATELEARGHRLHPRLWSAGVFLEQPDAVEDVHVAYLEAGADILVTASYQMSFVGLEREGLGHDAAAEAMRRTVEVGRRAGQRAGRSPTVAASVGPWGAARADGSEYTGLYRASAHELAEFHTERLSVLSISGADLLAVETIPSLEEARLLCQLLATTDGPPAWLSFCCRDEGRLADGAPLVEAAALADRVGRLVAVGVNCTNPEHVDAAIDALRAGTSKPIVVYPNSGECWDPASRSWIGNAAGDRFVDLARGWVRRGVWAVGGCCRVGPDIIRRLGREWGATPASSRTG